MMGVRFERGGPLLWMHMADQTYLLDFLVRLLRTHSPSGYTENAAQLVARGS